IVKNKENIKKMKYLVTSLILALMFVSTISKAQTAVDFTANDCSSTSHNLFTELDAGKIIVIAWVMPCGPCTPPALSAYTEVQNYASSNPGTVKFYIVDDYANTSCATLTTWANSNGITAPDAIFSNASINMSDYGSAGMPKFVILGGSSHSVFFNQNDGLDVNNFNAGISNALTTVGIFEVSSNNISLSVAPNPVLNSATKIAYTLEAFSLIQIDIINALGQKVKTILNKEQNAGTHEFLLNTSEYPTGIYKLLINNSGRTNTAKLIISE
ncbi:MAG: T9SS type A sorting domain-containing protein, partial [Bacteroidetes bacterium]|nr:T9SS type A sorting domain-containing protein [Bacteroidota bacterium]